MGTFVVSAAARPLDLPIIIQIVQSFYHSKYHYYSASNSSPVSSSMSGGVISLLRIGTSRIPDFTCTRSSPGGAVYGPSILVLRVEGGRGLTTSSSFRCCLTLLPDRNFQNPAFHFNWFFSWQSGIRTFLSLGHRTRRR